MLESGSEAVSRGMLLSSEKVLGEGKLQKSLVKALNRYEKQEEVRCRFLF